MKVKFTVVDLNETSQKELSLIVDSACDENESFEIHDSLSQDAPLAVLLPYEVYCDLIGQEPLEPWHGKATTQKESNV